MTALGSHLTVSLFISFQSFQGFSIMPLRNRVEGSDFLPPHCTYFTFKLKASFSDSLLLFTKDFVNCQPLCLVLVCILRDL